VTTDDPAAGEGSVDAVRTALTTERYEIRIRGRVSEATASAFDGLVVDVRPVETVLHGEVPDQAALHGLLDRVAGLGLELIEVRRLPDAPGGQPGEPDA
jgi:hypothetical protein